MGGKSREKLRIKEESNGKIRKRAGGGEEEEAAKPGSSLPQSQFESAQLRIDIGSKTHGPKMAPLCASPAHFVNHRHYSFLALRSRPIVQCVINLQG